MPPINTIMVHTLILPEDRRDATVLGQAQRLLGKRGRAGRRGARGPRVPRSATSAAADVMLGHALFMANRLGQVSDELENLKAYIGRIEKRPAFQTAITMQ